MGWVDPGRSLTVCRSPGLTREESNVRRQQREVYPGGGGRQTGALAAGLGVCWGEGGGGGRDVAEGLVWAGQVGGGEEPMWALRNGKRALMVRRWWAMEYLRILVIWSR
jgi:hypothetical protein